jgi:hypothetical protein
MSVFPPPSILQAVENLNSPGLALDRSRDRSKAQTRARKEGKGRHPLVAQALTARGRKGREEEGRSGPAARKGAGLRRVWIDGSMDRGESKRESGGRVGRGAVKIRRGKGTKESPGPQWLDFVLLIAQGAG